LLYSLKAISRELVVMVHNNITIDWTGRESIKRKLRLMVKKILRKYGYPPDKQGKATITVLEQAKFLGYECELGECLYSNNIRLIRKNGMNWHLDPPYKTSKTIKYITDKRKIVGFYVG
jgi:ribosomal protein L15E